jgi:hypothetical protein
MSAMDKQRYHDLCSGQSKILWSHKLIAMMPSCNSGTIFQLGKPTLQRHRRAPADRQTGSNQEPAASRLQPRVRALTSPRAFSSRFASFGGSAFPPPPKELGLPAQPHFEITYPTGHAADTPKSALMRPGADMRRDRIRGFQGLLV